MDRYNIDECILLRGTFLINISFLMIVFFFFCNIRIIQDFYCKVLLPFEIICK